MSTWEDMMVESGTWFSLVAQEPQKVIAATKVDYQSLMSQPLQLLLKSHWFYKVFESWIKTGTKLDQILIQF